MNMAEDIVPLVEALLAIIAMHPDSGHSESRCVLRKREGCIPHSEQERKKNKREGVKPRRNWPHATPKRFRAI